MNFEAAREVFEKLSDFGTDEEQLKGKLLALEMEVKTNNLDEVLEEIEVLLLDRKTGDDKTDRLRRVAKNRHRRAQLLWLKAEVFERQNMDATMLYDDLIGHYEDTHYGKLAQIRRQGKKQ